MQRDPTKPPQVFLSHRHSDKKIADLIRQWIEQTTAGRVKVFQSSGYAHGTKIGKPLSQELRENLWNTDVLLLLYTLSDLDWSYCMWECGVATDPSTPDTRVVVLQFSDEGPSVFDDQVRVIARSKESLLQFANQFLTDPEFFPRNLGAMTGFGPESVQLQAAGTALFESLSTVSPTKHEKIEEWPAWPMLRLTLSLDVTKEISTQSLQLSRNRLLSETKIAYSDSAACSVFGVRRIAPETSLRELHQSWATRENNPNAAWLESILSQVHQAAKWEFTNVDWSMLKSKRANAGEWFAPVVAWVRRVPYSNRIEFDTYFLPFTAPDNVEAIALPLPLKSDA